MSKFQFSIGILSWKGYDSLKNSLISYEKNGLSKLTNNKFVCLPEYNEEGIKIAKAFNKAIKKGGSSIRDFKNVEGRQGNFQDNFKVYQRENQDCKRVGCKGKIIKILIANRSTFFCNYCQN